MADTAKRLGILTSGGDAQGMNAAVRAVVRTGLARGAKVYAIYEGYQGMVEGGDMIRPMAWDDVGGIIYRGGTVIGTARSATFRTEEGRRQAARNLLEHEIDALVVIGGDGSLSGADLFHREWSQHLDALVEQGAIDREVADRHRHLAVAGLIGSIDNDMFGSDMTIGADTALHRITEAIDAISSTAASHQRSFVIEVMGRNCGYLALMSALATGAEWVLIPENPPDVDDWEATMCNTLRAGRQAGRRDSIIIVAEGAQDRNGNPIKCSYVKQVLEERLGDDARVTILGHVQRGGSPSVFDRNLSTMLGYAAVQALLEANEHYEPQVFGISGNRIVHESLMRCVEQTRAVAAAIAERDYARAMSLRGRSFAEAFHTHDRLARAVPRPALSPDRKLRLVLVHVGATAPGMNTAMRAAVRQGLDQGHEIFGVQNGWKGLMRGAIAPLDWFSVHGWTGTGGAELGTNRAEPRVEDLPAVAQALEAARADGLLIVGGWKGYEAAHLMHQHRDQFRSFDIPIICLPATIDNNLPGTELTIGTDTALNSIISVVDKIKQSAAAERRCYVVEVMGGECGYLALMSGLATGAEQVYLNEEGISLRQLQDDLANLITGFKLGKRLGLIVRNEYANPVYTSDFISALFEEEGDEYFDVRTAVLGHLQQGGNPSPFDRIQATRLAVRCIDHLIAEAEGDRVTATSIGIEEGSVVINQLADVLVTRDPRESATPWWLELRTIARLLAQPQP